MGLDQNLCATQCKTCLCMFLGVFLLMFRLLKQHIVINLQVSLVVLKAITSIPTYSSQASGLDLQC